MIEPHRYRKGEWIVYINKDGPAYEQQHNVLLGKPYQALEIRSDSVLIMGEKQKVGVMFGNIKPYRGRRKKSCDCCASNCKQDKPCGLFDGEMVIK